MAALKGVAFMYEGLYDTLMEVSASHSIGKEDAPPTVEHRILHKKRYIAVTLPNYPVAALSQHQSGVNLQRVLARGHTG